MQIFGFLLIGGGISLFANMQGDLQAQLIGVVMVGIGFLLLKNTEDKS